MGRKQSTHTLRKKEQRGVKLYAVAKEIILGAIKYLAARELCTWLIGLSHWL